MNSILYSIQLLTNGGGGKKFIYEFGARRKLWCLNYCKKIKEYVKNQEIQIRFHVPTSSTGFSFIPPDLPFSHIATKGN